MPRCRRASAGSRVTTPRPRGCGQRGPSRGVDRGGHRPLTNLALALRAEPALPTLLRRLVIMGGAYDYRGNTNPVAEWNIKVDPRPRPKSSPAGPLSRNTFRFCAGWT
ncbi:inosine-uridine preferring nucleoside hydrolase family protein [Mycobacterium xenopi 3993]|nr:inosine-uridine preferring nucleoside hydrolase family protein [Mycobacterium xenopi 3993]